MDDGEEDVAGEWELLLHAMDMEFGGPGKKMEPTPGLVSVCSKGARPWSRRGAAALRARAWGRLGAGRKKVWAAAVWEKKTGRKTKWRLGG